MTHISMMVAPSVARPDNITTSTLSAAGRSEEGKGGKGASNPPDPASPALRTPASPPFEGPPGANVIQIAVQGDDIYTPAPLTSPVVEALRDKGLYEAKIATGQHRITCPWASEHDADGKVSSYFEPTENSPIGRFRCTHAHGAPYNVSRLLDHVGVTELEARCQPKIYIATGELHRVVTAAERVLASAGEYYHSGGSIVAIRTDLGSGDVSVEPLNEQALMRTLSAAAYWQRWDGRAKGVVRCDPQDRIVRMIQKGEHDSYLPALNGLARQPFIRRSDGQVVTDPGYDPVSKIYAAFDPAEFSLAQPAEDNARAALRELKELIGEFRFDTDTDRSSALCAILTATVRSSLPVAPAFNIAASGPGSGKSYLASTIAPFAGPGEPMNVSYPTTAEEATKAMQSILMTKPAVVTFDDMQTDWLPHGAINRALTSETITDRVLGSSRTATVSTGTFFMGTGNNIGPVRDMCRRVVTIYLNPRSASPATLSYRGRPAEAVRKDRGRYVSAALTIIRSWLAAGSPRSDIPNIATYGDDWSDLCRQPLVWLGEPDPATSLIVQVQSDPDSEALGDFLSEWRAHFADRTMTVRKVIEQAERFDELKDTLSDLPVMDRDGINRSKLGWYLKKNVKRTVNGLQIEKGQSSERNAWKVVMVSDEFKAITPPSPPLTQPVSAPVPRALRPEEIF